MHRGTPGRGVATRPDSTGEQARHPSWVPEGRGCCAKTASAVQDGQDEAGTKPDAFGDAETPSFGRGEEQDYGAFRCGRTRQGRTRQGRTRQGRTRQGRTRQGRTGCGEEGKQRRQELQALRPPLKSLALAGDGLSHVEILILASGAKDSGSHAIKVPERVRLFTLVAVVVLAAGCSSVTKAANMKTVSPRAASPVASIRWLVTQTGDSAVNGWLDGVDCVTATNCVAVGNEHSVNGQARALVETMNGGSWTSTVVPDASNIPGDWLLSVSCPKAGDCVAVGYFFSLKNGGTGHMLIETLAKGTWSVTPEPDLGSGVLDSFLNGVSCSTPTTCVAVGDTFESGRSSYQPLIVTLSNGVWSVSPSPSLRHAHGALFDVSCTSTTSCEAVGFTASSGANAEALVEALRDERWTIIPSPPSHNGIAPAGLDGLSCSGTASCVAVGPTPSPQTAIDVQTKRRWSAAASPELASGDNGSGLYGVSCTVKGICVGVGQIARGSASNPPAGAFGAPLGVLIETNSGGPWTIDTNPSGLPPDSGLHAVSCIDMTCVAVGQSGAVASSTSTGERTLIAQTQP